MKPKRIFLIRHGESQGNVDKEVYKTIPDYALPLTENGRLQAVDAAEKILQLIGNETVGAYYSPYFRARQTADIMLRYFNVDNRFIINEPRLREQEWCGSLREDGFMHEAEAERDAFGHYYYRFEGGESCADVYDRVSDFFSTLHRDFSKPFFPNNCLLFGHGKTNRLFLMKWFHLSVEYFETLANPKNCETWILTLNELTNKYELETPVRVHPTSTCKFQYPSSGPTTWYPKTIPTL